jgi:hypothetical protein
MGSRTDPGNPTIQMNKEALVSHTLERIFPITRLIGKRNRRSRDAAHRRLLQQESRGLESYKRAPAISEKIITPNMSFTAFPTASSNLPRSVIITLGTVNGAVIIRLHTTGNDLHYFTTFFNRETFDTQFLWGNIMTPRDDDRDFIIEHQAVTVPPNVQTSFGNLRHTRVVILAQHSTAEADEDEEESEEDPPAPLYEPSPPHSNQSYHTPVIEPAAEGPQYQPLNIAGNPVELEGTTAAEDSSSSEEESLADLA